MAISRSSDECFNCQQLGHWAKDCPTNSSQQQFPQHCSMAISRSPDKCFKCQQLGHWVKDCPTNSSQQQFPQFSLGNDVMPPKMCPCARQCLIRVSNSCANPGRNYYKCFQCNFFEWCDGLKASASQSPNPNSRSRDPNPNSHSRNPDPSLSSNNSSLSNPSNTNSHSRNPNPSLSSNNSGLSNPSNGPNHSPISPNTSAHEELALEQRFAALSIHNPSNNSSLNNPSIHCECGAGPARVVTAKTGRDKGKRIYTCHIREGEGSCGFSKLCD